MIVLKKWLVKSAFVVGLSVALMLPNFAFAQICKVIDPIGAPLNIYAVPNGEVIGEVKNNTLVMLSEQKNDDKGRSWVLVFNAKTDRYIGWVYREFISCAENMTVKI